MARFYSGGESVDALAPLRVDADGNIVLDFSTALVEDADGNLAVSGVSQSELSFDPATQTELDNHAGDASAHHTRPSGTNSTTPSSGRAQGFQAPMVDTANWADSGDMGFNQTTGSPVMAVVDEIYLSNSSTNDIASTIHYADGTYDDLRVNGGGQWFSTGGKFVTWVELSSSYTRLKGINPAAPTHSHSI